MVQVLREQHGKRHDPNKYATERIAVSIWEAWRATLAENTAESYTKFIETWPYDTFLIWSAKGKIREAKYSPYLRWFVSHFWWIAWGAVVLLIIGIIIVGQTLYYHN